jgi:predicted O-methyltransferase YrrM
MPAVKPDVVDVRVATYATEHSTQPDAVQQALIDETAAMGSVSMLQIGGDPGVLLETIAALGADDRFDRAFVDADKTNDLNYYEALLPPMRAGGLVLVDNTLWRTQVLDASDLSADTVAIRASNDHVVADARVHVVLLTNSDGLTVIEKR